MGRLFDSIKDFYTTDDWPFEETHFPYAYLSMAFEGMNATMDCIAQVLEDRQQFVFYTICPFLVPQDKFSIVAEFLTRANCGIVIGNFEMNYDDGEIRYKTSIDVTDTALTHTLIRQVTYTNLITMDKMVPILYSLAEGKLTPLQAMGEVKLT